MLVSPNESSLVTKSLPKKKRVIVGQSVRRYLPLVLTQILLVLYLHAAAHSCHPVLTPPKIDYSGYVVKQETGIEYYTREEETKKGTAAAAPRYYPNVVLVGQFNFDTDPVYVSNWIRRWKQFFKIVHVRCPFTPEHLIALQEEHGNSSIHIIANDKGWWSPMKTLGDTLRLFEHDPSIDGVIMAHDDLLFDLDFLRRFEGFPHDKNLVISEGNVKVSKRKIGFVNHTHMFNMGAPNDVRPLVNHTELGFGDWNWGKRCIYPMASAMRDPRAEKYVVRSNTSRSNSTYFPLGRGGADFAYVPTAYATAYADIADWLVEHEVFLECSHASIVEYLRVFHGAKPRYLKVCTTWDYSKRRDYKGWMLPCLYGGNYTEANDTIPTRTYAIYHPVKFLVHGLEVWNEYFDLVVTKKE